MLFNSIEFLCYFLPLTLLAYHLTGGGNAVLLLFSLLFYAWGEPLWVLALVASGAVNHAAALLVERSRGRRRRLWLLLAIAANLALLGWCKYAAFLAGLLDVLGLPVAAPQVSLPLGVSFFTFQAIAYVVDVHRGAVPPARNPADTLLFLAFFPQLIAGPILHWAEMRAQFRARHTTLDDAARGLEVLAIGLAQKLLIADSVAPVVEDLFARPADSLPAGAAWFGLLLFHVQIYFDFAGYSNMAVGLGRLFGFRLPRNFDRPYASRTLTEFWQRWHLTLSAWFRSYLYVPLGGSRRGAWRTYRNLLVVFLACGLWHGAALTYVAWGLAQGLVLLAERAFLGAWIRRQPRLVGHAYLTLVLLLTWVLFRSADLDQAWDYFGALLGLGHPATPWEGIGPALRPAVLLATVVGLVAAVAPRPAGPWPAAPWPRAVLALGGLALSLLAAMLGTGQAFIYFRF